MTGDRIRLAILGINYAPELIGIAPYTTGLATGLASRGHDVDVLTGFPHYPQWQRAGDYTGFRSVEIAAGVRVRRLRHPVPQGRSTPGRTAMELAFGLQLLTTGWNHPEVVVCVSPPLLAAGLAVIRTRLTPNRPALGVLVHDVYSRAVIETGSMSGSAARAVRVLESAVTRHADGVAVIHDGFMPDLVERLGVDRARIRAIRNWTHVAPPDPSASAAYRAARGWGHGDVVILHAGNMGAKQGLENVIAAARLADRQGCRVRFVLLGDGHQRTHLEAEGAGVAALEFVPPIPEDEFPAAVGAADVLLVNERPGVAQMAVPSKLTSYFMSGKPVLAACDSNGFTALEVAASGAGICVPADRPDLLLREAVRLGTDQALAQRLGAAGRRYVAESLSADAAIDRYEQWIVELAATRRARVREVRR
ncbi:glycosyltransferase family 4 protein [Rhodococcus sp. NPDC058514]|uniref:glycosyltransferase family 4 protein n=1 Tax=unclassified Rhodococcus (in: high G+C Gram-positive bacteria) TaxID=192944 RepID=UPI00365ACD20